MAANKKTTSLYERLSRDNEFAPFLNIMNSTFP